MQKFLNSHRFPLLTALVFAAATAGAYYLHAPTGADIGNHEILQAGKIAGWTIGPALALVFLLFVGLLNLIRWILRLHAVALVQVLIVLAGLVGLFWFGLMLTGEDPFTPIARMAIEFIGRPVLMGSLISILFAFVMIVLHFVLRKK